VQAILCLSVRFQLGEFVGDREPPNLDVEHSADDIEHSTNDVAADESFSMYSYPTSSGTGIEISSVDDHHSRGVSAQSMHSSSSYVLPFSTSNIGPTPPLATMLQSSTNVSPHAHPPAFGQTRISAGFTPYPTAPSSSGRPPSVLHTSSRSTSRSRGKKRDVDNANIDRSASTGFTPQPIASSSSSCPPSIAHTGSRSTSRSRGKKRDIDYADIGHSDETARSKRSTRSESLHPAQNTYHTGTFDPNKITLELFASLIHGDIVDNVFPVFTDERFAELLQIAINLYMDKNPMVTQRPSNYLKMSFYFPLLNSSLAQTSRITIPFDN
jgi:hypothetical protein